MGLNIFDDIRYIFIEIKHFIVLLYTKLTNPLMVFLQNTHYPFLIIFFIIFLLQLILFPLYVFNFRNKHNTIANRKKMYIYTSIILLASWYIFSILYSLLKTNVVNPEGMYVYFWYILHVVVGAFIIYHFIYPSQPRSFFKPLHGLLLYAGMATFYYNQPFFLSSFVCCVNLFSVLVLSAVEYYLKKEQGV